MAKKGCGPYNLGSPKAIAKQVVKPDYKVNEEGAQVAVRDTKTDEYYKPTQAAVEKAKQRGTATARPFKGQIFDFNQSDNAPGYKTPSGEFIRANNPRELETLKKKEQKDRAIYTADENRRVASQNIKAGYGGTTSPNFKMKGYGSNYNK